MLENIIFQEGYPFSGRRLSNMKEFLKQMVLDYDEGIEYSLSLLNEEYEIIGCGSLEANVLKCIAISSKYQGMGLAATIVSNLVKEAYNQGRSHLFLFTKPNNRAMFEDLGFYSILKTEDILFMENSKQGLKNYIELLKKESDSKMKGKPNNRIGAIVANCNPFTNGHRYLIEQATNQCDWIHLFILSENKSAFPTEVRYELVRQAIKDMDNVILHQTSDYLISSATFPTYFIKEKSKAIEANCRLDLELFARIAPKLRITVRFVGTEPYCEVTSSYNKAMNKILPEYGIEVKEISRKKDMGKPISASQVRKIMQTGNLDTLRKLVPETTYQYIVSEEGRKLVKSWKN